MRKSVGRFFRSLGLTLWLVAGLSVYAFVATLVPQRGALGFEQWTHAQPLIARVASALGLTDAWNSPVFLIAVALLTVATVACAWERTKSSIRAFRASGEGSPARMRRLEKEPDARVKIRRSQSTEQVLTDVSRALGRLRLKVRQGPRSLEAESGRLGMFASPFFHWSLALLLLVVGLGRLTRNDGLVALPIGEKIIDNHAAYGLMEEGPLYGERHSGLAMVASQFLLDYRQDGVDRGPSPVISLYRGSRLVKRSRVFPNHPLSYGSLLLHMSAVGLSPLIALEDSAGREISRQDMIVDFSQSAPQGSTPAGLRLQGPSGTVAYRVQVAVPLDRAGDAFVEKMPGDPRVEITVQEAGGGNPTTSALRPGQTLDLPTGDRLRLVDLRYYARVLIVDDWSVTPIYVLFTLAVAGLSVALLSGHRRVWVLVVEQGHSRELHVLTAGGRAELTFKDRACHVVRGAVERNQPG